MTHKSLLKNPKVNSWIRKKCSTQKIPTLPKTTLNNLSLHTNLVLRDESRTIQTLILPGCVRWTTPNSRYEIRSNSNKIKSSQSSVRFKCETELIELNQLNYLGDIWNDKVIFMYLCTIYFHSSSTYYTLQQYNTHMQNIFT